ncbi:MAG: glycyl-radical enzyme activating protein [Spirochaetaceae bacterium]
MIGNVFDIYRLSCHDGPGLRTVLFLKGCPLRCSWCHNPESFRTGPGMWLEKDLCIGCGQCIEVCPTNALSLINSTIQLDKNKCNSCLECTKVCPTKKLKSIGTTYTVDEIMIKIEREIPFMKMNGGGLTISGGEPLLQTDFCVEVLKRCKGLGIHTAIDTCGYVSWNNFEKILPYTDLVLYDLKHIDKNIHKKLTGVETFLIYENLLKLKNKVEVWIRTPIILKDTGTIKNIEGIGNFLKENFLDGLSRWELCAFNPLATEKYSKLGVNWKYEKTPLIKTKVFESFKLIAVKSLNSSDKVYISGLTSK